MKRLWTILTAALLLCSLSLFPPSLSACNLSSLTLLSIDESGPSPVINLRLCIGAGRTGVINGADNHTYDLGFGIFGQGSNSVTVHAFTPSVTSTFRACEMLGYDVGPTLFPPFNAEGFIYYAFDPYHDSDCNGGFTCVNSTVLCGQVHQECYDFSFTLAEIPDSIRVWGVEGEGNPVAGCYPNLDMEVDLTSYQRTVPTPEPSHALAWNTISPNPTSGTATLFFTSPQAQPLQLQIYNPQGQCLRNIPLQAQPGPNHLELDLTSLPAAIYWLRLSGSHTTTQYKLLKH